MPHTETLSQPTLFELARRDIRDNPCPAMPVPKPGPHEQEVADIYILAAFDNAALMTFNNASGQEFLDDGGNSLKADAAIKLKQLSNRERSTGLAVRY